MKYEDLYRLRYAYHKPIHNGHEVYSNGLDVIVVREQYNTEQLETLGTWKETNPLFKVDYIQTVLPFPEHLVEYLRGNIK